MSMIYIPVYTGGPYFEIKLRQPIQDWLASKCWLPKLICPVTNCPIGHLLDQLPSHSDVHFLDICHYSLVFLPNG